MDLAASPDDFFVTTSQFTKKIYRDQYPAVNPASDQLSQVGKVAIITGASQGIGRQGFAVAFAKANAKAIVLVARNTTGLEAAAKELQAINPDVEILTQAMDVSEKEAVQALYSRIRREYGTVDVLVNNAALSQSRTSTLTIFGRISTSMSKARS